MPLTYFQCSVKTIGISIFYKKLSNAKIMPCYLYALKFPKLKALGTGYLEART